MGFGDIAPVFAAASAVAAAVSARTSRQAVTRANAPFVWPAITVLSEYGESVTRHVFGVRLHNDGPGVAFDVRFSVSAAEHGSDEYVPPPIRAMRSGEQVPPHPEPQEQPIRNGLYEYPLPGKIDAGPWWVIVRYGDALGRRWQVRGPLDPHVQLDGPVRLRGRRLEVWRPPERW